MKINMKNVVRLMLVLGAVSIIAGVASAATADIFISYEVIDDA